LPLAEALADAEDVILLAFEALGVEVVPEAEAETEAAPELEVEAVEDATTACAKRLGVATGMLAALHVVAHWLSTRYAVVVACVVFATPARQEKHGLSAAPTLLVQRHFSDAKQFASNWSVNAEQVLWHVFGVDDRSSFPKSIPPSAGSATLRAAQARERINW